MIISALPHYKMGGVETYNRKLISILISQGYEVHEFILKPTKEIENHKNVDIKYETKIHVVGGKSYFYPIKAKKIISEKMNDFDLIINCSKLFFKKLLQNNKHILVQHTGYQDYYATKLGQKIKWFFDRKILGLGVKGDAFEISSKSVFYSKFDNYKNLNNGYEIPLTSNLEKGNHENSVVLWAARLHNSQKGIQELIEIDKILSNDKIIVAGSGQDENVVKEHFGKRFLGGKKQNDLFELMKSSKLFILTSRYEGAAFTVTEALCRGLPVVLFDTFDYAKFYAQCDAVKVIKYKDFNTFAEEINRILSLDKKEYLKLSNEAYSFAQKYISDEVFVQKWIDLIKEVSNE